MRSTPIGVIAEVRAPGRGALEEDIDMSGSRIHSMR